MNQAFEPNYAISQCPVAVCRPDDASFTYCYSATAELLIDEFVWSIVYRWQALRVLQDTYQIPSIESAYCMSHFPYETVGEGPPESDKMAAEGPLPPPNIHLYRRFSAELRGIFNSRQTQRFYQALTVNWLASEALQLVRVSLIKPPRNETRDSNRSVRSGVAIM